MPDGVYVVVRVAVTGLMGAVTVEEMFKGMLELESGTVPPLIGPRFIGPPFIGVPLVGRGVLASGAFAMTGSDEGMVDGENSDGGGDDALGEAAVVARPRDE